MPAQISMRKLLQRRLYDIISHKYGVFFTVLVVLLTVISVLHFGEAVLEWSREKYASVFNSFSDNLGGRSYRERLCSPVPIDVVYTWVNGSDPALQQAIRGVKHEFEEELNISNNANRTCKFSNCIAINKIALEGHRSPNVTLQDLTIKYSSFLAADTIISMKSPLHDDEFVSFVTFHNESHIRNVFNELANVHLDNRSIPLKQVYVTSDKTIQNSILSKDKLVISGYPAKFSSSQLQQNLPEKYSKSITHIELYEEKGLGVITVEDQTDFEGLLKRNFTLDSKKPTLNAANYVWDLRDMSRSDDISASRFEDNEELRYSLRSLERFAPWVRHVYLVTNGQIPHWMNIDSPRVTLITHEEIFRNVSHLPTFSSPAIETHLHRIPGLSDKFIYLNDDVIFGKEVWPEDFYTDSNGYKAYLTWPIPNCNEGCPSTWILDGYCDKACNNSECEWDGGDCSGSAGRIQPGAGWEGAFHGWNSGDHQKLYCNTGCANSWLADKYCDTACNVDKCAFDAGDCGTDHYSGIHQLRLLKDQKIYTLPSGISIFYFNLTQMFPSNFTVEEAVYERNDVIRTAAISLKFRVLTVLLYAGFNSSKLNFVIKSILDKDATENNFTVIIDTSTKKQNDSALVSLKNETANFVALSNTSNSKDTHFQFVDIPLEKRYPNTRNKYYKFQLPQHGNNTEEAYQKLLTNKLQELKKQLDEGDITEIGFKMKKTIIDEYIDKHQMKIHQYETKTRPSITAKEMKKLRNLNINSGIIVRKNNSKKSEKAQEQEKSPPNEEHLFSRRNLLSLVNTRSEKGDFVDEIDGSIRWEGGDILNFNETNKLFRPSSTHHIKFIHKETSSDNDSTWQSLQDKNKKMEAYRTPNVKSRMALDTFADSLKHVNKLYNKAFGYAARKVPGHMPHMIDKHIMSELQDRFPVEWDVTSSHKIRRGDDMQYAFAYFYYLMGVSREITPEEIFDEMDTDKSQALSDREIRTLATKLFDLPLDLPSLVSLENMLINCSTILPIELQMEYPSALLETYYDKNMPQVTRSLFLGCNEIINVIKKKFTSKAKYKFETLDDTEIAFKMIKTNVSGVVGQLDDIRKNPKKFICLNDNIDHSREDDAKTVKAILQDFYEAILPIPSQFELPRDYRNRFLHIKELSEWKHYRDWLKFWTHLTLIILVIYAIMSYFGDKLEAVQRRLSRRLRRFRSEKRKNPSDDEGVEQKEAASSSSTDSDLANPGPSSIITL